MKRLLIVGAGGFGREVLCWAQDIASNQQQVWKLGGFLDDNPTALHNYPSEYPIVSAVGTYTPNTTDLLVCAIADPATKLRVTQDLEQRGATFISLIHPTAIIGCHNNIGRGCILCPRSCITTNVNLGNFVTLNANAGIGHDVTVGDYTTLSGFCDVTGKTKLGTGVFLGSHASILPGVSVGDFARVGAGSVVIRNVKPHTTVMGVPAKTIFEQPI